MATYHTKRGKRFIYLGKTLVLSSPKIVHIGYYPAVNPFLWRLTHLGRQLVCLRAANLLTLFAQSSARREWGEDPTCDRNAICYWTAGQGTALAPQCSPIRFL